MAVRKDKFKLEDKKKEKLSNKAYKKAAKRAIRGKNPKSPTATKLTTAEQRVASGTGAFTQTNKKILGGGTDGPTQGTGAGYARQMRLDSTPSDGTPKDDKRVEDSFRSQAAKSVAYTRGKEGRKLANLERRVIKKKRDKAIEGNTRREEELQNKSSRKLKRSEKIKSKETSLDPLSKNQQKRVKKLDKKAASALKKSKTFTPLTKEGIADFDIENKPKFSETSISSANQARLSSFLSSKNARKEKMNDDMNRNGAGANNNNSPMSNKTEVYFSNARGSYDEDGNLIEK
tara:strand:+ start:210 stop:1076 length:867 start_codon:yes stop_codon:yes gene_type:complete